MSEQVKNGVRTDEAKVVKTFVDGQNKVDVLVSQERGLVFTVDCWEHSMDYRESPGLEIAGVDRLAKISALMGKALDWCRGRVERDQETEPGQTDLPCAYPCPQCHGETTYLNVFRNHWGLCDHCRIRFQIGSNLFTVPDEDKTEEAAERARKILQQYTEV
jgi:hypothetical protein